VQIVHCSVWPVDLMEHLDALMPVHGHFREAVLGPCFSTGLRGRFSPHFFRFSPRPPPKAADEAKIGAVILLAHPT
jgi:hypothetical protein